MADSPSEPPTNIVGGPILEPHAGGCRCWPHVAQNDAVKAIEHAALMEYRSRVAEAADPSEPRTRAGRHLMLNRGRTDGFVANAILAIEAEAAEPAASDDWDQLRRDGMVIPFEE